MRLDIMEDQFNAIFGAPSERSVGRSRLCRSCGDWHSLDRPWPHNCRPPVDTPPQLLAAPLLAPTFEAFQTGSVDNPVTIGDPKAKREYMERNDLCEWYDGVTNAETWVEKREYKEDIRDDIRRVINTDPEYIEPVPHIGETDLGGAPEIDVAQVVDVTKVKDVPGADA